jgi:hypothetical protein
MTKNKIWNLSLLLLIACFVTGRYAIFTNGGNGNGRWYLLFWLFCTSLFLTSGWLLAKSLQLQYPFNIALIVFLTFLGFISSSVVGLMGFLGLPVLVPYSVFVVILLFVVKVKASKMK